MSDIISGFLLSCMGVLVVLMLLCLYRAVRGPRFTDRIVMSNAISTMVVVLIVLIGAANFGLNLVVVLLATMMDGAIVYPVIQGGGPMIAAIAGRLFFGEKISLKKAAAILLGVAAIVLLNL